MIILNKELERIIESGEKFSLELGCGPGSNKNHRFTVDIKPFENVDIVADINGKLDLIPDASVIDLYSRHTLEHVNNLIGLMEEIHRICVPGACVSIVVPHFSNTLAHSDPTHVRLFGVYSMFYFCNSAFQPKRKVPSFYSNARFRVDDIKVAFYRDDLVDRIIAPLFERIVNINMFTKSFYDRHLAYFFPAWEIRFLLRVDK